MLCAATLPKPNERDANIKSVSPSEVLRTMVPAASESEPRKRFRRDDLDEVEKMEIVEDENDFEEYVIPDYSFLPT